MGDRMQNMRTYKIPDPVDLYTVVQFTSWDHAEKRAPLCTYEDQFIAERQYDYYASQASGGTYYRILHTRINSDTTVTTDWLTYGT